MALSLIKGEIVMANVMDVARCFLYLDSQQEDGDGISNLKLQKLVYYAQGFSLALLERPLFNSEIQAWTHGPVVPELYHEYKEFGRNPIALNLSKFVPEDVFNQEELDLIKEVHSVFGRFSAWSLRNMTHEEEPWQNHERSADCIPVDELKEYFDTRV